MKQFQLLAPGQLELVEIDPPIPGPGEIVVRIGAALTCGTDLKTWRRGHPKIPLPSPFGHEFAGTVARVGAGVTAFAPGDGIMAVHTAPCGHCFFCDAGQENLCDRLMETKVLGAFAEELLLPAAIVARNAHPLPGHLDCVEAAMLEPLACVVYGDRTQPMRSHESLLIIGAGPVSLLFLLLARTRGVSRILVAGRSPERLRLARELGATRTIDVTTESLAQAVKDATAGRGVDQVIECTGQPEVWEQATRLVRKGGRVLLYGGCSAGTTATFDTGRLHYDELTLQGVFHFTPAAVAEARDLLADRRIDVTPLISERLTLAALPIALERLARGEGCKFALFPE